MFCDDTSVTKYINVRNADWDRTAILEHMMIAINFDTDEQYVPPPCFWPIVLSLLFTQITFKILPYKETVRMVITMFIAE